MKNMFGDEIEAPCSGHGLTNSMVLPTEILQSHVLPHLDVAALLQLRSCSRYYQTQISRRSNQLWKTLHDKRWTMGKTKSRQSDRMNRTAETEDDNESAIVFFDWFHEYARRHKLDASVRRRLVNASVYPDDQPNHYWSQLLLDGEDIVDRLRELIIDSTSVSSQQQDIFTNNKNHHNHENQETLIRHMASRALVGINRYLVFREWKQLIDSDRTLQSHDMNFQKGSRNTVQTGNNITSVSNADRVCIEDGAILLARFYLTSQQLVKYPSMNDFVDCINTQLNDLALELKSRLEKRHAINITQDQNRIKQGGNRQTYPMSWILEEMQSFFVQDAEQQQQQQRQDAADSVGQQHQQHQHHQRRRDEEQQTTACHTPLRPFTGNQTDYYNYHNSLINHVLTTRTGIPITLAVIYAAIVRRGTGATLDPIGLPGHFVLGTPPQPMQQEYDNHNCAMQSQRLMFVDVFHGGKILSLSDCTQIVESYGVATWDDGLIRPISKEMVWQRMVRNLLNCHSLSRWGGDYNDDDDNDDDNVFCQKIATPVRFLITDLLYKISEKDDMLVESPPLYLQYC